MLIKLGLMPAFASILVGVMLLSPLQQQTAVLDLAMPSMVLGIVLCDRYALDSALYAAAVTATTTASLITLPLWHATL
jgi:predicted permease